MTLGLPANRCKYRVVSVSLSDSCDIFSNIFLFQQLLSHQQPNKAVSQRLSRQSNSPSKIDSSCRMKRNVMERNETSPEHLQLTEFCCCSLLALCICQNYDSFDYLNTMSPARGRSCYEGNKNSIQQHRYFSVEFSFSRNDALILICKANGRKPDQPSSQLQPNRTVMSNGAECNGAE